jgi:hypothetical protein
MNWTYLAPLDCLHPLYPVWVRQAMNFGFTRRQALHLAFVRALVRSGRLVP